MKIIGITGGTGSGKTTALMALEELGAKIIDCDREYHDLLENDPELSRRIQELFPGCADASGRLDRKALGRVVFSDKAALARLNALTHAFVTRRVDALLAAHQRAGGQLAAVDAIALIESGLAEKCSLTVAVISPAEERVKRLTARDGVSEQYARLRIAAQKSDDFFRKNCTYCLENAGLSRVEFEEKAITFFKEILDGGGQNG